MASGNQATLVDEWRREHGVDQYRHDILNEISTGIRRGLIAGIMLVGVAAPLLFLVI